eukprot:359749-Chlamydomonas_euryale.AAC.7
MAHLALAQIAAQQHAATHPAATHSASAYPAAALLAAAHLDLAHPEFGYPVAMHPAAQLVKEAMGQKEPLAEAGAANPTTAEPAAGTDTVSRCPLPGCVRQREGLWCCVRLRGIKGLCEAARGFVVLCENLRGCVGICDARHVLTRFLRALRLPASPQLCTPLLNCLISPPFPHGPCPCPLLLCTPTLMKSVRFTPPNLPADNSDLPTGCGQRLASRRPWRLALRRLRAPRRS